MSTQKFLAGEIGQVNHLSTSDSGWKRFEVTLKDGTSFVGITQGDEPAIGKEYKFNVTKSGDAYFIDDPEAKSNYTGGKRTYTKKSGGSSRDNYWANKEEYEQQVRDPKIEFQTYFREVMDTYRHAIPHLKEVPDTPKLVDALIKDAYLTAKELYQRVQDEEPQNTSS